MASLFYNERIFSCENFMDSRFGSRSCSSSYLIWSSTNNSWFNSREEERRPGGVRHAGSTYTIICSRDLLGRFTALSPLFFLDSFLNWLFNVLVHLASSSSSSSFCCLKSLYLWILKKFFSSIIRAFPFVKKGGVVFIDSRGTTSLRTRRTCVSRTQSLKIMLQALFFIVPGIIPRLS